MMNSLFPASVWLSDVREDSAARSPLNGGLFYLDLCWQNCLRFVDSEGLQKL